MKGSSPLTRGKLLCRAAGEDRRGLIPAHAGKTLSAHRRKAPARALRSRLIPAHAGKT